MTNINPNNDVGKINHSIKKESKVNKKEKPVAEIKSVEASSLDALNSYGKASITFRGVEKKQDVVTKEQVLQRLNEMDFDVSDYYREDLVCKIKESLYYLPDDIDSEEQIKIIEKYLSDSNLYKNKNVQDSICNIINSVDSVEKYKVADIYLSNPNLYENDNLKNNIYRLLDEIDSEEKIIVAEKLFSEPLLYENYFISMNFPSIFNNIKSEEIANFKVKIIDEFLSDSDFVKNYPSLFARILSCVSSEEQLKVAKKINSNALLYKNQNINYHYKSLVKYIKTEESANEKIKIMDKYISEDKLNQNEWIQNNIAQVILPVESTQQFKIANIFLSNPEFYNDKHIQNNIYQIIYDVKSDKQFKIADKFFSDSNLYKNEWVREHLNYLIRIIDCEEEYKLIDTILSEPFFYDNPQLQYNITSLVRSCFNNKEATNAKIQIIDKYLSNSKLYEDEEIRNNIIRIFLFIETKEESEYIQKIFDEIINGEMSGQCAVALIQTYGEIDPKKIRHLQKTVPTEVFKEISQNKNDLIASANLVGLYNKNNINEIPLIQKRDVLREIVKNNINLFDVSDVVKENFPLIPKNAEEYCTLLPSLVKSLGIETNEISVSQEKEFDNATKVLSTSLAKLTDQEFNNLSITQEYSKDEFIKDTLSIVKDIPKEERQKVYDYFGFELHHNRKAPTGFSIAGYPVNLNNGKKLAQIEDENTKQVVEQLRPYVIKFSENNKISCDNKDIETSLNEIVETLPEFRTTIGREQYGMHEFDVLKHSLKLMQKTVQNPKFETLNDSDKKIMMLSALLHDITKAEIKPDPLHNFESSFDAFYISKKFNLTQDERIKLYTLINHHEWLKHLNNDNLSQEEATQRIQSVAFDFQNDNLFELTKLFTESDIKAIMKDNTLYDRFSPALNEYSKLVEEKIGELKKTQPLLPTTKLPKASDIKSRITTVNEDCSTNIKGVYLKDGLVVIKYNEVEDWETIGLAKGSISRGIKTVSPVDNSEIDTGNIKFIAHGLDYPNQLSNFDAFELPDADALLSVSYMERPESKYRLFRTQGVLLDVDSKYIHGGGETDSGSGYGKNINEFKTNYAYEGSVRYEERKYISDLIKQTLNLSDEEYIEFVNQNKNKSMLEIEPKEAREKLIKQFALINSNTRNGNRGYNEMYVSNPKVQGVFAYSPDDEVGEINNFIDKQHDFLKDYAKDNDVPFVVFGD